MLTQDGDEHQEDSSDGTHCGLLYLVEKNCLVCRYDGKFINSVIEDVKSCWNVKNLREQMGRRARILMASLHAR